MFQFKTPEERRKWYRDHYAKKMAEWRKNQQKPVNKTNKPKLSEAKPSKPVDNSKLPEFNGSAYGV